MWDALNDICRREGKSLHEICTQVDLRKGESSLTAAIRVFIMSYFRDAATEDGHYNAGHGTGAPRHGRAAQSVIDLPRAGRSSRGAGHMMHAGEIEQP